MSGIRSVVSSINQYLRRGTGINRGGRGINRYPRYLRRQLWVPAGINRWTGLPHEDMRESARRRRQMGEA